MTDEPCGKPAREKDSQGEDLFCCCDAEHMKQLKKFIPTDMLGPLVANYQLLIAAAAADNPMTRPRLTSQRMAILEVCFFVHPMHHTARLL